MNLTDNNEQAEENIAAISFASFSLKCELLGVPLSPSLSNAIA